MTVKVKLVPPYPMPTADIGSGCTRAARRRPETETTAPGTRRKQPPPHCRAFAEGPPTWRAIAAFQCRAPTGRVEFDDLDHGDQCRNEQYRKGQKASSRSTSGRLRGDGDVTNRPVRQIGWGAAASRCKGRVNCPGLHSIGCSTSPSSAFPKHRLVGKKPFVGDRYALAADICRRPLIASGRTIAAGTIVDPDTSASLQSSHSCILNLPRWRCDERRWIVIEPGDRGGVQLFGICRGFA